MFFVDTLYIYIYIYYKKTPTPIFFFFYFRKLVFAHKSSANPVSESREVGKAFQTYGGGRIENLSKYLVSNIIFTVYLHSSTLHYNVPTYTTLQYSALHDTNKSQNQLLQGCHQWIREGIFFPSCRHYTLNYTTLSRTRGGKRHGYWNIHMPKGKKSLGQSPRSKPCSGLYLLVQIGALTCKEKLFWVYRLNFLVAI